MELITKSKRPGMNCSMDIYYEQTVGFSKYLNDKTCYKFVLINSGSFIVEDKGKYITICTPAAIIINEKSDFKIIAEDNIKSRTVYFKPSVIREEFNIESLNSGEYGKFLSDDLITGDTQFEDSFSNEMVYQDALLFLEFFRHNRNISYYSLTLQEFDTIRRFLLSIEYEINEQPDNFWILRTRYFLESLLFMLTADFYRNERMDDIYDDPLVAKVTRFFWDHIDEEITLELILKKFSVNKNALNDAFNKEVSMSCMTYLEKMRVNLAKSELQFGHHTVSEISRGVGYSDTNYFSKVFKKHTGLTPSEFQKQMKGLC